MAAMKTNAWRYAALAFAGGALVLGCGPFPGFGAGNGTHAQRGFPFSGPSLTIAVTNADVAVEAGGGGEIAADRWTTGSAQPTWSLSASTLTRGSSCGSVVIGSCGTRFQLKTPSGVAVTVHSDRSDVRIGGLAEPLTLHAAHGDVRVEGTSGSLDLTTESGDLNVVASRSPRVTATSTSGDASLAFATPPTEVRATCTNGDLHVALPRGPETYRITASADHGSSNASVASDPSSSRSITAQATNGDVSVSR
jgi:putative adhesin